MIHVDCSLLVYNVKHERQQNAYMYVVLRWVWNKDQKRRSSEKGTILDVDSNEVYVSV